MRTSVLALACLASASYQTVAVLANGNNLFEANAQLRKLWNVGNAAGNSGASKSVFSWKQLQARRQGKLSNAFVAVAMLLRMFNPATDLGIKFDRKVSVQEWRASNAPPHALLKKSRKDDDSGGFNCCVLTQCSGPLWQYVGMQLGSSDNLFRDLARCAEVSMLRKDEVEDHRKEEDSVRKTSVNADKVQSDGIPMFVCDGVEYIIKESGQEFGGGMHTGYKIWESGRILSRILLSEYRKKLPSMRVLELGSGTGVGGLTAAAAGASVLLTDGSLGVLSLLEANIRTNGLDSNAAVCNFLWGYEPGDEMRAKGPFDLIIGSDLLYAPDAFSDLLVSLEQLCIPGHTEVLLTFPMRYTEDMFFDDAAQRNFKLIEPITEVEPYLFRATLQLVDAVH